MIIPLASVDCMADWMRAGRIAAFPTETVYGLGARAGDHCAVAAVYRAKQRPPHNPLIVHVADLEQALQFADFAPVAKRLAAHFWPGALTLVLPLREAAPISPLLLAKGSHATIALRVPTHPQARALLAQVGAVAAPSANASGRVSAVTPEQVVAHFGGSPEPVGLFAGEPPRHGIESTVVRVLDMRVSILRPGAIPHEAFVDVVGADAMHARASSAVALSPGQLPAHYAPRCNIRLNVVAPPPDAVFVRFGTSPRTSDEESLSPRGDFAEAARRLYPLLHKYDRPHITLAFAPIPEEGLGVALNDRLQRAATV